MGTEYEIIQEYVDILRDNLSDINPERASTGKQWIFDELPRDDLGQGSYPRIAVTHLSTTSEAHELNAFSERAVVRLHVVVYVRAGQSYTNKKDNVLLDELSNMVRKIILSQYTHDRLVKNVGVFHHFIESAQTIRSGVLVRQLTFKNVTKV